MVCAMGRHGVPMCPGAQPQTSRGSGTAAAAGASAAAPSVLILVPTSLPVHVPGAIRVLDFASDPLPLAAPLIVCFPPAPFSMSEKRPTRPG